MSHLLFAIRQRQTEYANRQSGQVESLCLWVRLPLRSVKGGRLEVGDRRKIGQAGFPSAFLLPPPIPWSNGTTPVRHTGDDGSTPSGIKSHRVAHTATLM